MLLKLPNSSSGNTCTPAKEEQPVEEPIANNHVEKQRIKPDTIRSAKSNLSIR
jgi:hypothetical protein